jgi:hypothetical protein
MARKPAPLTDTEQQKLDELREQAAKDPLDWFKHENGAHMTPKLRMLIATRGMAAYGLYWVLMEKLAAQPNHFYDVNDDIGWLFLARDLSPGLETMTVEQCRDFVGALDDLGLIDHEELSEAGLVISEEMCRCAHERNESTAQNRFKGWRSGRARRGESG